MRKILEDEEWSVEISKEGWKDGTGREVLYIYGEHGGSEKGSEENGDEKKGRKMGERKGGWEIMFNTCSPYHIHFETRYARHSFWRGT